MVTISFGPFDALAVLGAVTGVVALVWQIVTWRKSTHRVKVAVGYSYPVGPGGAGEPLVSVTARNVGAAPVDVVSWGLTAAGKGNLQAFVPHPWSEKIPSRVANGSQARFFMPKQSVVDYHNETKHPYRKMRGWVTLATGQTVRSRKPVRFKN